MDEPIRVMVVDDTDHVRRMLRNMLDLDGFSVVAEAASGAEALERVEEVAIDVAVIDYKMPTLDGLETAARIRAGHPDLVMILYTAFVDPELERRAGEVGVSLVLGKVEGLESLEREITRLCRTLFSSASLASLRSAELDRAPTGGGATGRSADHFLGGLRPLGRHPGAAAFGAGWPKAWLRSGLRIGLRRRPG
ncbi:hypothetical protein BH20ACT1_BH20ACT1_11980 [soil metagenome]